MSFDNYIPIIRKIKKELDSITGDTVKDKAKTLSLPEHTLRRALSPKPVLPVTAERISTALGKNVNELFFR